MNRFALVLLACALVGGILFVVVPTEETALDSVTALQETGGLVAGKLRVLGGVEQFAMNDIGLDFTHLGLLLGRQA